MTNRYDVLTARESNGKAYFTKLGAMFPNRSGDGFTVMLDAMPAPVDGQYKLIVKVPKPREGDQQRSQGGPGNGSNYGADLDDDVPF